MGSSIELRLCGRIETDVWLLFLSLSRSRRLFAERIHLRDRVINLPVKPVIFQRVDLLQPLPCERAADRLAGEIPRGRRLVDKLNRRRIRLNVKIQSAPVDSAFKGADGFVVIALDDEQGRYAAVGVDAVEDQPLLFQSGQRI